MIIRSQEKWRPIGSKGANGRALDPQRISRTTFRFISQIIGIRVQGIVGQ